MKQCSEGCSQYNIHNIHFSQQIVSNDAHGTTMPLSWFAQNWVDGEFGGLFHITAARVSNEITYKYLEAYICIYFTGTVRVWIL